jgi:hypothetical protein
MRFILPALLSLLAADTAFAASRYPGVGPYIFTGTATVLSGGSGCLGSSPLNVTGDAVVANKNGNALDLHIKAATGVSAVVLTINNIPLQYGVQSSGSLTYVLLPQTASYTGTYNSAVTTKGRNGNFGETITVVSGPFVIGGSGSCQIGLDITATPGINKALLKLFNNVL